MSFARFRESGELSDITVVVDGSDFRLHKFPLFAKSDYFCGLARDAASRVELQGFPGDADAFGLVADFCYNINVCFTLDNVVQLRCAAEFLQMTGPENLAEMADKFLQDMVTSAKMSRSVGTIVKLLSYCCDVGPVAERAKVAQRCLETLTECLVRPPTKFTAPSRKKQAERDDEKALQQQLYSLPLGWFARVVSGAREKGIETAVLGEMIVKYIKHALERQRTHDPHNEDGDREGSTSTSSSSSSSSSLLNRNLDGNAMANGFDLIKDTKLISTDQESDYIVKILDSLLPELPEEVFSESCFSSEWTVQMLMLASSSGHECRRLSQKVARLMLGRLSSEALTTLSPEVLGDVVSASYKADRTQAEDLGHVVDKYLSEMSTQNSLQVDTYKHLANIIPSIYRTNQENLFSVLESLLQKEHDNLPEEECQELLSTIDFSLLSEETLQRALEREIIPTAYIARAALGLCTKLRMEMETMKQLPQQPDPRKEAAQSHVEKISIPQMPYIESSLGRSDSPESRSVNEGHAMKTSPSNMFFNARSLLPNLGYPYRTLALDQDYGIEDEVEFKYDRSFRSLDQHLKTKDSGLNNTYNYRSYNYYPRHF